MFKFTKLLLMEPIPCGPNDATTPTGGRKLHTIHAIDSGHHGSTSKQEDHTETGRAQCGPPPTMSRSLRLDSIDSALSCRATQVMLRSNSALSLGETMDQDSCSVSLSFVSTATDESSYATDECCAERYQSSGAGDHLMADRHMERRILRRPLSSWGRDRVVMMWISKIR